MLRQRVITALILAALFVLAIIMLPVNAFGVVLLLIVAIAAWEWSGLLALGSFWRWIYCGAIVIAIFCLWWLSPKNPWLLILMMLTAVFWCYAPFWLSRYASAPQRRDSSLLLQFSGGVILVLPWLALMELRSLPQFGSGYVLFLMLMIWLADSGAYFAGRAFGRHKLAPAISPGKTWEGAMGALLVTLVVAIGGSILFALELWQWPLFIILCCLTVAFSIVGDLFESMIKRQQGVKDSGTLLPGHGGVLDRVDSLTAAAPLFLLGLMLMLTR